MSNIVNLRHARKSKARKDKASSAEQNRAKYGRTKAEREYAEKVIERSERDLDGKKHDLD